MAAAETTLLPQTGGLGIRAGQASQTGAREANEDCMGLRIPEEPLLTLKGAAAVIADGVSSAEAGREASESCVQSFLSDYFSTPDSWTVRTSAQKVLTALNRWLYSQGQHLLEAHRGYVSTLSILVLKSRTAHLVHVGDTRIYRVRDGRLEQLTRDHATQLREGAAMLTRAMGMDVKLELDYRALDLAPGDVFFLSTDGVHDYVPSDLLAVRIGSGLLAGRALESICRDLCALAASRNSPDNLTCQLLVVDSLPGEDADELHRRLTQLPFPPPLDAGTVMDGYRVEAEIHASARSQLYRVTELASGATRVMKTPSLNFEDDPAYLERFVMEPWIARRVAGPNVVPVVDPASPPTTLYYLMEWVEGETLAAWIQRESPGDIASALAWVDQLATGLRCFHRRETLHQDLKPDNVLLGADGVARIVDFGSCYVAGVHEIAVPLERDGILGTAPYTAPELRLGRGAGLRSEQFSLGILVYEMLTGAHPYGEALSDLHSTRGLDRLRYQPSYHHHPMIPVWMDAAIRRAVQPDPAKRYDEISEFLYDLHHPNPVYLNETPRPLIEREPVRFWKGVAGLLAAALAVAIGFLVR